MGESALEGLEGVKAVSKGWSGFKEINTVTYDPAEITVDEMTRALKTSGTFRGVAEE